MHQGLLSLWMKQIFVDICLVATLKYHIVVFCPCNILLNIIRFSLRYCILAGNRWFPCDAQISKNSISFGFEFHASCFWSSQYWPSSFLSIAYVTTTKCASRWLLKHAIYWTSQTEIDIKNHITLHSILNTFDFIFHQSWVHPPPV